MTSPFVKNILDMLSDLNDVRSRSMFGGYGIYHDGVMIGLIASGVFYLKVDDGNRTAFEVEGSKPFTYPRTVMRWGKTAREVRPHDHLKDLLRQAS